MIRSVKPTEWTSTYWPSQLNRSIVMFLAVLRSMLSFISLAHLLLSTWKLETHPYSPIYIHMECFVFEELALGPMLKHPLVNRIWCHRDIQNYKWTHCLFDALITLYTRMHNVPLSPKPFACSFSWSQNIMWKWSLKPNTKQPFTCLRLPPLHYPTRPHHWVGPAELHGQVGL